MTESSRTRDEMDAEVAALPPLAVRLNESAAYRDLFGDLTPDEARVITGLVRAMREGGTGRIGDTWPMDLRGDALTFVAGAMQEKRATAGLLASGAWHIAHAISQMGES